MIRRSSKLAGQSKLDKNFEIFLLEVSDILITVQIQNNNSIIILEIQLIDESYGMI